jgi:hypothetical protein
MHHGSQQRVAAISGAVESHEISHHHTHHLSLRLRPFANHHTKLFHHSAGSCCSLPYLKADVLSFPVAVQPQHQIVNALALSLQVAAHMRLQDTRKCGSSAG